MAFGDVAVINNKQHLFHSLKCLSNFWKKHSLSGAGFSTRHKWIRPESTLAARAPQEPEEIFHLRFWSSGSRWQRGVGVAVVSFKPTSKWKSASNHTGPYTTPSKHRLSIPLSQHHAAALTTRASSNKRSRNCKKRKTLSENRCCSRKRSEKDTCVRGEPKLRPPTTVLLTQCVSSGEHLFLL